MILEINNIEQLEQFKTDWDILFRDTPGATYFQSFNWLKAYWRHFGTGNTLRTLLLIEQDQPIAIVPFVVRQEETRVGRLRVLTYPLDNWGSFYGPIGRNPAAALKAAMEYVHSAPRDWDMIELRWLGRLEPIPYKCKIPCDRPVSRRIQPFGIKPRRSISRPVGTIISPREKAFGCADCGKPKKNLPAKVK